MAPVSMQFYGTSLIAETLEHVQLLHHVFIGALISLGKEPTDLHTIALSSKTSS